MRNLRTMRVVHWVNVSESSGTGSASACEESEDNEGGTLG